MEEYKFNATRALDWKGNKATMLPALLQAKEEWYSQNVTEFWDHWRKDVFDLRTASPFGLLVWSFILNVPAQAFLLFPRDVFWAYGANRQNYFSEKSGTQVIKGGNFLGGNNESVLTPDEARKALRMKYYALTIANTIPQINRALRDVFGVDEDGLSNAWVMDNQDMTMTYFHKDSWSEVLKANMIKYEMLPKSAGVSYTIVDL